ncbi:hypothetical protein FQA39_LY00716 [Lamprigera yunnana]|nr:hypothetical protein FQA39_LY00716 [Lamprigera yunnana]
MFNVLRDPVNWPQMTSVKQGKNQSASPLEHDRSEYFDNHEVYYLRLNKNINPHSRKPKPINKKEYCTNQAIKQNNDEKYCNRNVRKLSLLAVNRNVKFQKRQGSDWKLGIIKERLRPRSYKIKTIKGEKLIRNRNFIEIVSDGSLDITPDVTILNDLNLKEAEVFNMPTVSSREDEDEEEWIESGDSLDDILINEVTDWETDDIIFQVEDLKVGDYILALFVSTGNRAVVHYKYVAKILQVLEGDDFEVN